MERFKANVETWFNDGMERVSGWYKRRTQVLLLFWAVVVTVATNADTIVIARALWRDPALRQAVVARAEQYIAQQPRPGVELAAAADEGEAAAPPLRLVTDEVADDWPGPIWAPGGWARWYRVAREHFIGWLLTIMAVSLGAPFWFDTLNKIISIRSAGKAPEEAPKRPKEVPQPKETGGM